MARISIALLLVVSTAAARAWNIPGHMLSGAIAYQTLSQESPATIDKVNAVLKLIHGGSGGKPHSPLYWRR
jgi:hypothetical protein